MQHPNKKITDLRRLRKLYEEGAVFTAFDTETSGISPTNSRIIEIGAVQFTKDGIISKWQKLFDPDQILSYFIIHFFEWHCHHSPFGKQGLRIILHLQEKWREEVKRLTGTFVLCCRGSGKCI